MVAQISETIGRALGSAVDTMFGLVDNLVNGLRGETGNKIIDSFVKGFQSVITPDRLKKIKETITVVFGKVVQWIGKAIIEGMKLLFASLWNEGGIVGKALIGSFLLGPLQFLGTQILKMAGGFETAQQALGSFSSGVKDFVLGGARSVSGIQGPMPTPSGTRGLMAKSGLNKAVTQLKGGFSQVNSALKYGAQETRVGFQMLKMGQWKEVLGVFKGGNVLKNLRGFGSALGKGVKTLGKFGGIAAAIFAI